jgi:uncharacterized protein YyaL (SSP411 family)
MANRLAASTSPYLLQHKDNPVDWFEWGEEAFAEARRRDVPILLSVGYAACHWCHVMAHESFEDPTTAAAMNTRFVNVKVDREERPDVDAVYMSAAHALTGQGGWPMTAFLTHGGAPFFAGTYFPPRPRPGLPAFTQLLDAITDAWQNRRDEVEAAARRISAALSGRGPAAASAGAGAPGASTTTAAASAPSPMPSPVPSSVPSAGVELAARAVRALAADEDRVHGGFGGAPKFPPSMDLEFLLRHAARLRSGASPVPGTTAAPAAPPSVGEVASDVTAAAAGTTSSTGTAAAAGGSAGSGRQALAVAGRTLHAMARSGMYDQVAGGFARYAVDRAWVVPHFEKMLYDNALLASVYLHWWRLTGEPTGARIAEETCDWMLAALRTPQGGLASSLDADTPVAGEDGRVQGVEGLTYVWTPDELARHLPAADDAAWAARLLRVTEAGTFEHGTSTLQLDRDVWADPGEAARWRRIRGVLAEARGRRPQPGRDDKVVAAWNGLAIAALAETGALLDRPDLVTAAERIADLLLTVHLDDGVDDAPAAVAGDGPGPDGPPAGGQGPAGLPTGGRARLRRVSREGRVGTPAAVLEDYGDVAHGLLALHAVTGSARWLQASGALLDTVLAHFTDDDGTLYDTADFATDPALAAVRRPKDPMDGAYPSGTSAAAAALLGYAAATGSIRHRDAAESALAVAAEFAGGAPLAFGWALAAVEALLDGPREVAVVGHGDVGELHRVALMGTAPGLVVSAGAPDAAGVPLLRERPVLDERPTAYVCRGFVCEAPTTSLTVLAAAVGARLTASRRLTA